MAIPHILEDVPLACVLGFHYIQETDGRIIAREPFIDYVGSGERTTIIKRRFCCHCSWMQEVERSEKRYRK